MSTDNFPVTRKRAKRSRKVEKVCSFRVDDALHERIRAAAAADDRRPGAFLRRLVNAALPADAP